MQKYIKQYRRDGYCTVPRLLPPKLHRKALKETDAVFASQLKALKLKAATFKGEDSLHANMERLFKADNSAYLSAARHLNKLLALQEMLFNENILAFVKKLGLAFPSVPTGPVVSIMSDRLRIPGGYFGLSPHQDWPSIQGSLDAVTIWAPLTDVTVKTFPLQVIPKSHLKGMWEGENTASAREINPNLYTGEDFVALEMKRGDVAFMSGFTVHRTGIDHQGKECAGLRIAANTRIENTAEPTFIARRFPCAYKRTVERELIAQNFPTNAQVKKVFSS